MSIGFLLEDPKQAVVWRGPMLHGALQQFLEDVDWGELDYLVLDLPPGTGDVALTLSQKLKVTGAVIVTTPQEVALQDVYKSVSMCAEAQHPDPRRGREHELLRRPGGRQARALRRGRRRRRSPSSRRRRCSVRSRIEPTVREWGDEGTPVVQARARARRRGRGLHARSPRSSPSAWRAEHFERAGGDKAPGSKGPTRLKIMR